MIQILQKLPFRKFIFLVLFVLSFGKKCLAQDEVPIVRINVNNGSIENGKLPYGKYFILRGRANYGNGVKAMKASLLVRSIDPQNPDDTVTIQGPLMWNNIENRDYFEFPINPLRIKQQVFLSIKIRGTKTDISYSVDMIKDDIIKYIVDEGTKEIKKERIVGIITDPKNSSNLTEKKIRKDDLAYVLKASGELLAISKKYRAQKDKLKSNLNIVKANMLGPWKTNTTDPFYGFDNKIDDLNKKVESLKISVEEVGFNDIYTKLINSIDSIIKLNTSPVSDKPNATSAKSASDAINSQIAQYRDNLQELASLWEQFLAKTTKGVDDFNRNDPSLNSKDLTELFSIDLGTFPVISTADYDALRWGFSVGGSFTAFNVENGFQNWESRTRIDLIGYLGVKYYFRPVDKSVPFQFAYQPGLFDRLSFFVGTQIGPAPTYKGVELKNAVAGVRPVLGLSYDIGPLKYVSFDAGIMLFKYDKLSGSVRDTEIKFSPFVGISLDLDLFNRLAGNYRKARASLINPFSNP